MATTLNELTLFFIEGAGVHGWDATYADAERFLNEQIAVSCAVAGVTIEEALASLDPHVAAAMARNTIIATHPRYGVEILNALGMRTHPDGDDRTVVVIPRIVAATVAAGLTEVIRLSGEPWALTHSFHHHITEALLPFIGALQSDPTNIAHHVDLRTLDPDLNDDEVAATIQQVCAVYLGHLVAARPMLILMAAVLDDGWAPANHIIPFHVWPHFAEHVHRGVHAAIAAVELIFDHPND